MINKSATISQCGKYRYDLTREWDVTLPTCVFIGLNPSTADADVDDPTTRRCVGFAKRFGCGKLIILNLFSYRATKPDDMLKGISPIGEHNYDFISAATRDAKIVVAAWGTFGGYRDRDSQVVSELALQGVPLMCLGKTKDGKPRHPLYVRGDQELIEYANI